MNEESETGKRIDSDAEARQQLQALRNFLVLARAALKNVKLDALHAECEHFESFAPFFDPSMFIEKRSVNTDLKEWIEAIRPLKAKLEKEQLI